MSDELACNPFLRIDEADVIHALANEVGVAADRVARFTALRRMKDDFRA